MFNRPSIARAVLKSPLSLVHWFNKLLIESSFFSESSRHCLSPTIRARELTFWENVQPSPCDTWHVSGVRCQFSSLFVCKQSGDNFLSGLCHFQGVTTSSVTVSGTESTSQSFVTVGWFRYRCHGSLFRPSKCQKFYTGMILGEKEFTPSE